MKTKRLILTILLTLAMCAAAWADGTVSATYTPIDKQTAVIYFAITGDSSTGAKAAFSTDSYSSSGVPYTALIRGWDLVEVRAYPTAGGTAPLADSDVTITENSLDLLDGNGTDLIQAATTKSTYPKNDGQPVYTRITSALTVTVTGQTTASANYTIEMRFEKTEL